MRQEDMETGRRGDGKTGRQRDRKTGRQGDRETDIDIYDHVLKYPPFAAKRRPGPMRIEHKLKNGNSVVAEATESITTEDAEKLFAAILVSRVASESDEGATLICHIKDIRKVTNDNDDEHIVTALERLKKLTITADYGEHKLVTGFVAEVTMHSSGLIVLVLTPSFWQYCRERRLSLNVDTYCSLPPVAKNLYSFIVSNSGDVFKEETLIERAVIEDQRKDNAQLALKRALNVLTDRHIIRGYRRVKKDKTWYVAIARHQRNGNYP